MKGRWLFPVLLTAPFALAVFFWDFSSEILLNEDSNSYGELVNNAPETIVENTELIQFDSTGAPAHWLRSKKLVSDDMDGLLYISEPLVNIDPDQENSWDVRSNTGIFDQHANFLRMTGEVLLIKRQDDSAPITMSTETLDYFPDKNFAESDTPVIIETLGHRIETTGISVDFKGSVYKLKSNVRSNHDPI